MTGAIIALWVKQPVLAVVLAFTSHFVLDIIPHFGLNEKDVFRRNAHWLFRTVLGIDTLLTILLLIIIPQLASQKVAWGIILASMIAAILPDAMWVPRFVQEIKSKKWSGLAAVLYDFIAISNAMSGRRV